MVEPAAPVGVRIKTDGAAVSLRTAYMGEHDGTHIWAAWAEKGVEVRGALSMSCEVLPARTAIALAATVIPDGIRFLGPPPPGTSANPPNAPWWPLRRRKAAPDG